MVTKEFQQLCEKEFALKQDEAYKGFDRELDNLREHYAYHGLLVSSPRAQAVMDAALLRFDLILDGFENAYLAKFSDPTRMTDEEDVTWLKKIVEEKMEPAIFELRTKVQSDLWEQSCALTRYWQKVESEARKRSQKIREKIEIIQLQKKEWAMEFARFLDQNNHSLDLLTEVGTQCERAVIVQLLVTSPPHGIAHSLYLNLSSKFQSFPICDVRKHELCLPNLAR